MKGDYNAPEQQRAIPWRKYTKILHIATDFIKVQGIAAMSGLWEYMKLLQPCISKAKNASPNASPEQI